MYECRLHHLGLLGSSSRTHRWRRTAIAVLHTAVRVAVRWLRLRVRLVRRGEVLSICAGRSEARGAHGRGRGRCDVHAVLRRRERAGGRQDGNGPVHGWVVVARERTSAGLCDRRHQVETRRGRMAAVLRCWAAKPMWPSNSAARPGWRFSQRGGGLSIAKPLLDWDAGSPDTVGQVGGLRFADCGLRIGGAEENRRRFQKPATKTPAVVRC